jgi:hypothetical protein
MRAVLIEVTWALFPGADECDVDLAQEPTQALAYRSCLAHQYPDLIAGVPRADPIDDQPKGSNNSLDFTATTCSDLALDIEEYIREPSQRLAGKGLRNARSTTSDKHLGVAH